MNAVYALVEEAGQWSDQLQAGTYRSQAEIARSTGTNATLVSYALKAVKWPKSVIDWIQKNGDMIYKSSIIEAGKIEDPSEENLLKFFGQLIEKKDSDMDQAELLVTSYAFDDLKKQVEELKSSLNSVVLDDALFNKQKIDPNKTPKIHTEVKVGQEYLPEEAVRDSSKMPQFRRILGNALSVVAIICLTSLGAFLTQELYLDYQGVTQFVVAFSVLAVIGVVLPVLALQSKRQFREFAYGCIGLGLMYSASLIVVGNYQKGVHLSQKNLAITDKIAIWKSEKEILVEQHQQWHQGYRDPEHRNYHKKAAADKAKKISTQMAALQQK